MKNQINFKSGLGEIKKENSNLKPTNQISIKQSVEIFIIYFHLKEKIIDFLGIILSYYLKLDTKQNMEVASKY